MYAQDKGGAEVRIPCADPRRELDDVEPKLLGMNAGLVVYLLKRVFRKVSVI